MPHLEVKDCKLYYTIDDHTDPWTKPQSVLFVHGFTENTEAWQQWVRHQVMLINEYRLTPIEPAHRKRLEFEMERFFFGEGSSKPADYVPK